MRFALGHPDVLAGGHRVEVATGRGEVPNDDAFCKRVSEALAKGYVLYGDPVMVVSDGTQYCGQAVMLPGTRHANAEQGDD